MDWNQYNDQVEEAGEALNWSDTVLVHEAVNVYNTVYTTPVMWCMKWIDSFDSREYV